MQRVISFDIARALCILLVVIGHYYPENSPAWYRVIHDVIYSFHMPLFMFISGYIFALTRKEEGFVTFIGKKFRRLMVPYFVISVAVITCKLIGQQFLYVESPVEWQAYYRMFYLPAAGFYLWFIFALFIIFALTGLFRSRAAIWMLFGLSIALYMFEIPRTEILCLRQVGQMMIYFMSGMVVHRCKLKLVPLARVSTVWYLIIFVNLYLIGSVWDLGGGYSCILLSLRYITAFAGIALVYTLSRVISTTKNRFLLMISSASYIIYLFHTIFEGIAKAIIIKIGIISVDSTAAFVLSAIVCITAGILGPLLLYKKVLFRNRMLSFLFGK